MSRQTTISNSQKQARTQDSSTKQLQLLKHEKSSAYGGVLQKTRKGRARGRPLALRNSMHFVMRSSLARGEKSFSRKGNRERVDKLLKKFAAKHQVELLQTAIVGNHIHAHVRLASRRGYFAFIRAVTAAISVSIGGKSRWSHDGSRDKHSSDAHYGDAHYGDASADAAAAANQSKKFWDHRPFSRIVTTMRYFKNLTRYIEINQLEGWGRNRIEATQVIEQYYDRKERWLAERQMRERRLAERYARERQAR